MTTKVYLWDVLARRARVKWKMWTDSTHLGWDEWWATVSSRYGVMDGNEECKYKWGGPVKGDVKHGMNGEVEHVQHWREGSTIGMVVQGHCCKLVLVDYCLHCRVGRSTWIHGIIEGVVCYWSTMRMREYECECKKVDECKKRRITKERQRNRWNEEQKGWKGDKKLGGEG
ncbi:uncharacterized protein FOMMEDRAFT_154328 [Fomitiporia mediterranea MF3/22]|uniref:uncharacterized protein n=1 Tax=Fomitiporia mediterranea (strain MF3/22) TaxID=694068 RepID=UPI000440841E|nr:uncharacterized protein FOMMEDRAFT_154328 [Fomitiporia mediterranea MF3/22]EJD05140.1 hypothetical protein FOMMEDRAFT_154328 [Fomitiporia mediterranea MF3/22]